MIFFSEDQILNIHSALITKTGGIDGIWEYSLLDLSLQSIFQTFDGKELYPSVVDKAAQLCYSLIESHPFLDDNKRIGVHLALIFLKINGIDLHYSQDELIDFGLAIASSKMEKDAINNPDASVGVCCSHKVVAVGFNTLCYDASVGVLNPHIIKHSVHNCFYHCREPSI